MSVLHVAMVTPRRDITLSEEGEQGLILHVIQILDSSHLTNGKCESNYTIDVPLQNSPILIPLSPKRYHIADQGNCLQNSNTKCFRK